jgi:transcriptional regulator with XRE-family HTH domain
MLKIMTNETEIFRAWLHRAIKGKRLSVNGEPAKAKDLANALGISEATLTGYHLGRSLPEGERHFPDIPHDRQMEILHLAGTARDEMLRIGKRELAPKDPDIYKRVEALEQKTAAHAQSASNITNMADKHKALIDEFQQKELALEINHLLVELERKNPALLTIIKAQLSGMAAECAPVDIKKRTTGNGKA